MSQFRHVFSKDYFKYQIDILSVEDKLETLSIKLVSFLRGNSENNSGAKSIPMFFARCYQATPEQEGSNEDPDNEKDMCIAFNIKIEWLFHFVYEI